LNKTLLLFFMSNIIFIATFTVSESRKQTYSPINYALSDDEGLDEIADLPTKKPATNTIDDLDNELSNISGRFSQLFSPGCSSIQPGRRSLSDQQPLRSLSEPFNKKLNVIRKKRTFSERDNDEKNTTEETSQKITAFVGQPKVAPFTQITFITTLMIKPLAQKPLATMLEDTIQEEG
jgi:hypothetical protein